MTTPLRPHCFLEARIREIDQEIEKLEGQIDDAPTREEAGEDSFETTREEIEDSIALADHKARKWTAWGWGIEDDIVVGGGATVGMKAICLAYVLGYRKFKLFGYDSSYLDGENHAWRQPLNDGEGITEVVVRGVRFTAAKWMVRQVREFQEMSREMLARGCEFEVFGSGLFQHVCRLVAA